MSERIRGALRENALYKSTYTLLYTSAGAGVSKESRGGEVFDVETGHARGQRGVFVDSLDSPAGPTASVDGGSLRLADRIACLENDFAAKTCEIEALRDQARYDTIRYDTVD